MKTIFRVAEKTFFEEKNAIVEAEITGIPCVSEKVKEKDYKYLVDNGLFEDCEELNNADKKNGEDSSFEATGEDGSLYELTTIEEIGDQEPEQPQKKVKKTDTEGGTFEAELARLTKRLNDLEAENKNLKTKKVDFSEIQKTIEARNKTLREIEVFENIYTDLVSMSGDSDAFWAAKLTFTCKHFQNINPSQDISITNTHVLERFVHFLRQEITIKLQELRNRVEILENSIY